LLCSYLNFPHLRSHQPSGRLSTRQNENALRSSDLTRTAPIFIVKEEAVLHVTPLWTVRSAIRKLFSFRNNPLGREVTKPSSGGFSLPDVSHYRNLVLLARQHFTRQIRPANLLLFVVLCEKSKWCGR
jgi:hypothetical protein